MENGPAVTALRRKRTQYCAKLTVLNHDRRELVGNIQKLDDALRLFGVNPGKPAESKPRLWLFRRGELTRMVCTIEREAGAVTSREIAAAIIARMEWNASDAKLLTMVVAKVTDVRARLAKR
ncbi:MAG: hypothetical protein ABL957_06280 [Parvularculaceae bacterium]